MQENSSDQTDLQTQTDLSVSRDLTQIPQSAPSSNASYTSQHETVEVSTGVVMLEQRSVPRSDNWQPSTSANPSCISGHMLGYCGAINALLSAVHRNLKLATPQCPNLCLVPESSCDQLVDETLLVKQTRSISLRIQALRVPENIKADVISQLTEMISEVLLKK